ncbi:MAG: CocE/NonD family hydrolase [Boseongicola sp. SB0662_bin_57]|nr:CocE/NonD family hydrolase [Boseongicola sp. SB0662_bin_57]
MTASLRSQVFEFDEVEHQWIPMPDGVRLAARIWLPRESGPMPAILEYIPYRKRDMVRARDERNHPHFAANGYACIRVDMRGSGDSEGHMPDMYSDDELADARHVIDWIAAQSWCDGKVGMFGTSWGGTASMQAAVNAPRALKAVIANCATTDRFEDDIHWMGGCLLTDSFEWGATLPAILAAPPDAATVGPGWMETWRKRLDRLSFPLSAWISHQTRRAYWRHGSVTFSTNDLSCPILAIGGWADRYSNSVIGLVRARPDLCHGIVGPWGHHYPDHGEPGPAMSFQDVALTWWDHWLKDAPMPDWPRLRLWQRAFDAPADRIAARAGRWVSTGADNADATETVLFPGEAGLSRQTGPGATLSVPADPQHGTCAGDTGYFGRVGGLPLDQSPDDARALCFDTEALETEILLVGHAEFHCDILRDMAQAQLVCRLCEVDPNGRSNLVTRQVINLRRDETLDGDARFAPGQTARQRLRFPSTAYRFSKGNRIRLCIAASYWPLVWPAPRQASMLVDTTHARLVLPCPSDISPAEDLPPPRCLPLEPSWESRSDGPLCRESGKTAEGESYHLWRQPWSTTRFPEFGLSFSSTAELKCTTSTEDHAIQKCAVSVVYEIERPDGTARIESNLLGQAHPDGLSAALELDAHWNGEVMAERSWKCGPGK